MSAPQLLVLGHITLDHISGEQRLGGAAAYASRVAASMGVQTGLVTFAPADFELLDSLEGLPGLQIKALASEVPTTFELVYGPSGRTIRLLDRAPTLTFTDIPAHFLGAQAAYIAPVIGECPIDLIETLSCPIKVAGLQGWLRYADSAGMVQPHLDFSADDVPRGLTAVVFSEEDHPLADVLARELTQKVAYVVLTRGSEGLTLFTGDSQTDFPALEVEALDPTGAGDTLGTVLTCSLLAGFTIESALDRAIMAASLVVQGPELGKLEPQSLSWDVQAA